MFQINVTELKSQLAGGRKVGHLQRATEDFEIVTSALPHLRPKPLGHAASRKSWQSNLQKVGKIILFPSNWRDPLRIWD